MSMIDFHTVFQEVLQDLIRVTHCHGCGMKYNVGFFGYVKQYCDKTCWRVNVCADEEEYDAPDEDSIGHYLSSCCWCIRENEIITKTHSLYHHDYFLTKFGIKAAWPMKEYTDPCHNECILTCPTVSITNYNCNFKPANKIHE